MVQTLLIAVLLFGAPPADQGDPSKVNDVLVRVQMGKTSTEAEQLELIETDVNAWIVLALQGREQYGLRAVSVDFLGTDRILGSAEIDMDKVTLEGYAVQLFKSLMTGIQKVAVQGHLEVAAGQGIFTVQEASLNGVSVPPQLATQILSYVSANQPPNIDITKPFNLPPEVRSVKILEDRVVIVR